MLLSMTGYGKAECLVEGKKYIVEIRSLNSKQADINLRVTPLLREKELEIRSILAQSLERGKIDCSIWQDIDSESSKSVFTPINTEALDYYVSQISAYAKQKNISTDPIAIAMRIPDVMKVQENVVLSAEEWEVFVGAINSAIEQFNKFRKQEGQALQNMFEEKLKGILLLLSQVEPLEGERVQKIRSRLEESLKQLSEDTKQAVDRNRLEQEMIFYLEKLDITEEKVRLRNHIRYFFETMNEEKGVGKKLGFVAQEMGREINTLGSKSNHSEMQIIVVKMKDILEQIKEQVLNVL
ncbi:MAG: YicC family protein [Paludibacteraceae bacterium]|nr:YicC family protein [Paludibacteraceae bacterium]